ncbi:YcxB family protein [Gracilibacillus timonensis]|uniref:YcxB family protein n=1 Tax=Gracilibacillus timonensis TaxID=1816696 RepID=UPI000824DB73|nr:YcxB family protein [Gracilibacillus timonensis]
MANIDELEITAEGALTYDEFKKYNMYRLRKILIGFFFITFFLEVCLCWILYKMQNLPFIFYIGTCLFASGLVTFLAFKTYKKRIKKEFNNDRLASKEMTYTINQEGINYQVGKSQVCIEWGDIVKGAEHKDMFCLYISSIKAIVLPKRYFKSDEDIMAFKQLISTNTDKVKLRD